MVKVMKQNAERCVYYDFFKREGKRVGRGDGGERVFGLEQTTNWADIYRTGVRRRIFNVPQRKLQLKLGCLLSLFHGRVKS